MQEGDCLRHLGFPDCIVMMMNYALVWYPRGGARNGGVKPMYFAFGFI